MNFEAFDSNGDGYADTYGIDNDYDGYVDEIRLDANQDGIADSFGYDYNEDGVLDAIIADGNQDGVAEAWVGDVNGDGVPESFVDYNQDGYDDRFTATVGGSTSDDPLARLTEVVAADPDPVNRAFGLGMISRIMDSQADTIDAAIG